MAPTIRWKDEIGRKTIGTIVKKVIPGWTNGLRPVQEDLVTAILDGDDVLCCTATGDGKSAAFSVPILVLREYNANPALYPRGLRTRLRPVGVVVTPTKGLANNIVSELAKLQISAFAYCRESIADARRSGANLVDEIKACSRWEVVCVDPEHLQEREWRTIADGPVFRTNLLYSAIDEAHLINIWGAEFREAFKHVGRFFRGCFPSSASVVALTATLAPGAATSSVCTSLGLFDGAFHLIRHSNERPNVQFIMQTLTHGLTGYEFPDLLPFLNTGRKICIHCETLDLVFRVYVYIWRLQPPTADKFRRVRMYHSLCPPAYNEQTIHLIDNDPQCQIIISTVAFTNGINARKLLDSISLGFAKTVDIMWQEKGRVGREPEAVARGVVLVQLSSISAAIKQLEGPTNPPKAPAKRRKAAILKKPRAPMETVKAQFLVEKRCYYAFLNRHYANPPLELTTLDCIAAKRPLPCSLCITRSNKTITYTAPVSALALPRLIPQSSGSHNDLSRPKKLKLKAKERKPAHSSLKKFRKQLRVNEQLAGCFRHHPPSLFLPSSLQDAILDQLLSFASSSDLLPLLDEWYHRDTHTESLFQLIRQLQTDIHQKRDEARKETNRKARATRKANKRKAAVAVSDSEETDEPDSEHDDDLNDLHEPSRSETPSNDPFPAALLPKPTSRGRKRQALEEVPTNTSTRRPREALQKAAEVSKDYGPQYRPRIRR